jgi:hypothetical protein
LPADRLLPTFLPGASLVVEGGKMRNVIRKIAFIGTPDGAVAESLREFGYRLELAAGDSIVGLARELYRVRPALVHARQHHLKSALVGRLLDVPVLLHACRSDVGSLTARAARMSSRTLCGGAAVREALILEGASASSTCVLRSLIDVSDDVRAAATFPPMLDPAIRWVVAASPCDGPERGHSDLLLAFLSLARTRPRLKLLIAGDGPDAARLRAQAQAAGMLNRVVVHGVSLEQLPSIFARAAVVVGASRSGNSPDPVPEALAVGAPVVATAVGSHPSWIREGRTGWLVPARAPVALAARLAPVIDDPVSAKKVGDNARAAALELAAPRAVAQELARARDVDLEERVHHVAVHADLERVDDIVPLPWERLHLELGAHDPTMPHDARDRAPCAQRVQLVSKPPNTSVPLAVPRSASESLSARLGARPWQGTVGTLILHPFTLHPASAWHCCTTGASST